ncbi:hypothetical protein [Psychromonas sp. KJ10-2]|uniref:hypothetical protein n=1 Tax=Psychromonas sp. KJ10-2 TaxID=3391822 RepID=UPI0039B6E452
MSPIIDIANSDLINVTQNAQKVRVDFYKNEIHISISHTETKQRERENRLISNLSNGSIKTGVACVGIGVSTAAVHDGLAKGGVISTTEFIVDRERKYLDVATKNNHAISDETLIFEASLEEVEPELIPKVDILGFSLPCTGHSLSGITKK